MMLADMGAEVVRLRRPDDPLDGGQQQPLHRGKSSLDIDLKVAGASDVVLRIAAQADGLIEGFRPGVAERLGVGPVESLAANPRLVYGRVTGWGQDGPLATAAGHDINYIALTGVLDLIGSKEGPPVIPLNLLADFGGGGMLLAFGVVCGLLEAERSGLGQVIDAAMVDGAAHLASFLYKFETAGFWKPERGTNILDGGAPFYDTYETSDGEHVAVGAIEPQFYAALLEGLGLAAESLPKQNDQSTWVSMRERFAAIFRSKTREEWCRAFDGTDACVAPVLALSEVHAHPHNAARSLLMAGADGKLEPGAAPRLSRTPGVAGRARPEVGAHTREVLAAAGFDADELDRLVDAGVIG